MKNALILVATLASLTAAPAMAREPAALLSRALSCQVGDDAVATLMAALAAEDAGMKKPAQSFAAPSGALYRLGKPVSALGYSTNQIYVSPGRILMAVPGQALASVSAKLRLESVPDSPDERRIDATHALVAYQLHQDGLADMVLLGCAYDAPAAAGWLASDDMGF